MVNPYYQDDLVTLHWGTAASVGPLLNPGSVRTIVTSPPYFGLRDYGHEEQIGAEGSVQEYVDALVGTFRALRAALADDGTLWLNIGDSYATDAEEGRGKNSAFLDRSVIAAQQKRTNSRTVPGLNRKNLLGVPWRVAFALQADGWILRSDIIWAKPNPMPESVTDRPTKAHEYLFLFAKSPRYYYDAAAIAEGANPAYAKRYEAGFGGTKNEALKATALGQTRPVGMREYTGLRNKRTVWDVPTVAFSGAHFATYPPGLVRPCILAGSARGDTVLDPFSGSGTTGMVALQEGRRYIGIDVNSDYLDLSLRARFQNAVLDMTGGAA